MRRMRCKCGSEQFKIHPKDRMVQCCRCSQRYSWWEEPEEWREFNMTSKDVIKEFCLNTPKKVISDLSRATKDFIEVTVRHPKREKIERKPEKIKPLTLKKMESMNVESRIRYRWHDELTRLLFYGTVEFSKHEHKGKLRGKNIAKAFHTDVKRIGLKTRLNFKGMTGIVKRL